MSNNSDKALSIKNGVELLDKIINDPKVIDWITIDMLKDQKSFSSLNLPELNIHPMSLNRWKFYADEHFVDGWKGIDKQRKKALAALRKALEPRSKPSRGSKTDLQERLEASSTESQHLINEIARFSDQYMHLIEICKIEAKHNPQFDNRLKEHQRRYSNGTMGVVSSIEEK